MFYVHDVQKRQHVLKRSIMTWVCKGSQFALLSYLGKTIFAVFDM